MTLDARRDRTQLRLKLYENGFTPLANKSKLCLIKEWSTIEVTPALIQSKQWARSGAFQDTGLRCGQIIALDFDIDDPELLNTLLDEIVVKRLVEESPFVRIGKPPRELWVYRTSEKIGKRTTGHFTPPNWTEEDGSGFAVEILGAGCQFAAFGQRDEDTAYAWPEESPLEHVYMDLPTINLKQVEALRDYASAFFEHNGLERRSAAGGTDGGYSHVYDLDPATVFDVKDMGPMTVAEMAAALAANPGEVLRARADAFRPTSGSWACMVSLVGKDICISDHGTYTSHFPAGSNAREGAAALGRLLAERFPDVAIEAEPIVDLTMDPTWPLDDNLDVALRRYVYVENDGIVCDLKQGFMTHKIRNFHDDMGPYKEVKQGPQGGETVSRLADMWRDHPKRLTVATMQMRPDMPRPMFEEDGSRHINTYEPVDHGEVLGDAAPGLRMIENLLPVLSERTFFLQWLSYKLQHPAVPGPAVVMVARDSYGTGRGSLIALMTDMIGQRYVNPVDFATLTGQGSQSQYNEWQSDSLLVVVDEAKETAANISSWQTRNNAYEHLKSVVDPSGRGVHIKRKGVKNSKARTYASIFIATNHGDAFVIPANDRRIAVLENGPPMGPAYWDAFHAWRADKTNIAALVAELKKVDLTGYNPYAVPPMTAAKADMIESGASDLDRASDLVLKNLPGALLVRDQFLLLLENSVIENGFDFPDDWQRVAEKVFVRKTSKILTQDRVSIEGKMRTVRMLGRCSPAVLSSPQSMIEEVLRNGPLSRQLKTSSSVVQFPQRR